jgi:AcrR family transcriptional regulator
MFVGAESSPSDAPKARRVLDAALACFAERGVHGTSIPLVLERAGVGASSLYRRFASKEALVNAVFRDAKQRLGASLREAPPGLPPRAQFADFWARLAGFARREPVAFRFLELQDHAPYLDGESRAVEMAVLAPVYLACLDFQRRGVFRADVAAETIIAFVWGAFVGLFKAERTHHVMVTDAALGAARDACWRAFVGPGWNEDDESDDPKEEKDHGDDGRRARTGRGTAPRAGSGRAGTKGRPRAR